MSIFRDWTETEVAARNAKVAGLFRLETPLTDAVQCAASERKLHDAIEAECKRRGFYYVHARMDMATTTAKGVPDFIIALPGGRTIWAEIKGPNTKVTREQAGALHWLNGLGHVQAVVRSLDEFLAVVKASDNLVTVHVRDEEMQAVADLLHERCHEKTEESVAKDYVVVLLLRLFQRWRGRRT